MEPRRDELLRAIADAPDAIGPYLAYADEIAAEDAPRAELIRVQIALETARGKDIERLRVRARELLHEHASVLVGPLAEWVDVASLGWFRGFLSDLRTLPLPAFRPGFAGRPDRGGAQRGRARDRAARRRAPVLRSARRPGRPTRAAASAAQAPRGASGAGRADRRADLSP